MVKLLCKTLGDMPSAGKTRVYFCAHPEDFGLYFSSLSEDILRKQECAVWYRSTYEETPENSFYLDLSEMNLFVVLVTARFLETENEARCIEFQYALKNHIPILPFQMEPGLEGLFNEVCGPLQILDLTSADATALGAEEKLRRYLESICLGRELAVRIEEEFSARLFLSYRKKDRRFANDLMRKIHKNPKCLDFAIWYDEFLNLGEDFNESIQKALKKSEVFLFSVTESVLEEPDGIPNYVMREEYPRAREAGKHIFAVEMQKTDRVALHLKYKGLSEVVSVEDDEAFSCAVSEMISAIHPKQKEQTPEHQYLIGRAYLSGLFAEVDYDRALALISSAAEAGHVEALEKLIYMYQLGEGVACDMEKVREYRCRLLQITQASFAECPSAQTAVACLSAHFDLCGMYCDLMRYQEAEEALELAISQARQMVKYFPEASDGRQEAEHFLGVLLGLCGNVFHNSGQFQRAENCYAEGIIFSDRVAERTDSPVARRNVMLQHRMLGDLLLVRGNVEKAIHHYCLAVEIQGMIAGHSATQQTQQTLLDSAILLNSFARALLISGNREEALTVQKKGIEKIEQLVTVSGEARYVDHRTDMYSSLGDNYRIMGDLQSALNEYTRAWESNREYEKSGNRYPAASAKILANKAICFFKMGDEERAMRFAREGARIWEQKARGKQRLKNMGNDILMILYYYMVVCMNFLSGDEQEQRCYAEKAIELADEAVAAGIRITEGDCVQVYADLSGIYLGWGDAARAEALLGKAARLLKQSKKAGGVIQDTSRFSFFLNEGLYYLEGPAPQSERARESLHRAEQLLLSIEKQSPGISREQTLPQIYFLLGQAYGEEQPARAKDYFSRAYEAGQAVGEEKGLAVLEIQAISCYNVSCLSSFFERKRWEKRVLALDAEMRRRFPREYPSTETAGLFR